MKTILVIDDDRAIQDSLTLTFDPVNFRVIIHADANKVFDGDFEQPDIFIIDKQLSGVDGLDVCRHLKSQLDTKNTPIIMISASPTVGMQARQAGADEFIEKPYTIKQLRDAVARLLK